MLYIVFFFFSSRRRHTRWNCDWSSDVCSSDLELAPAGGTLPYGATKRWGEQLLETFQRYSRIVVLRLPSLYGTGQADSFIDGLARTAQRNEPIELLSRGDLIFDALHVDDVVRAIESC